jgi:hypothetical protein
MSQRLPYSLIISSSAMEISVDKRASQPRFLGSPYKAMQVWEYRPVLLCKHLILRHVLPEAVICNLLKLLTCTVL